MGTHQPGCSQGEDQDGAAPDPKVKEERARAAMEEVKALLADAGAKAESAPREALELCWLAQDKLEVYPAQDLQAFDARRQHNDLTKQVGKAKDKAGEGLGDGEAAKLVDDLAFAKKALEHLGEVSRRRREAATFDLNALGKLPRSRVNYAREEAQSLDGVCLEIEARLNESIGVEKEVDAWGSPNLPALVRGQRPAMIPAAKTPSAKSAYVAVILGVALLAGGIALDATQLLPSPGGPAAAGVGLLALLGGALLLFGRMNKVGALPGQFMETGIRHRERIYLSAALRMLRRRTTRLQKAEETFRKLVGGDNAPRWKRVRTENKDAIKFFVDWDGKRAIEDTLNRAVADAIGRRGKLRSFDEVSADDWDVLARALSLDLAQGDEAQRFDALAGLIAEGESTVAELAIARRETNNAWSMGGERRQTKKFTQSSGG